MAPIWGIAADRFGHRMMIQRASFGAGIAIACIALVQTPGAAARAAGLHGVFTGVVTAIATLVSLTAPRQHLGTVLGTAPGGAVSWSVARAVARRAPSRIGSACERRSRHRRHAVPDRRAGHRVRANAAGPRAELTPPRASSTAAGRPPPRPRSASLSPRSDRPVVGLMALVRFAQTAPQPFMPLFVQQLVDSPEGLATTVGIVLAAAGIASTVSALSVGRLSRPLRPATALDWLPAGGDRFSALARGGRLGLAAARPADRRGAGPGRDWPGDSVTADRRDAESATRRGVRAAHDGQLGRQRRRPGDRQRRDGGFGVQAVFLAIGAGRSRWRPGWWPASKPTPRPVRVTVGRVTAVHRRV